MLDIWQGFKYNYTPLSDKIDKNTKLSIVFDGSLKKYLQESTINPSNVLRFPFKFKQSEKD